MTSRTFDKNDAKKILRYTQILIIFALLTTLVVGCGDNTRDGQSEPPDDMSSSTRLPTELITDLVSTCEESTEKLGRRKEAYVNIGDTRGAQLMGDSATKTEVIQEDAQWIESQLASLPGAEKAENVNLAGERGDARRDNQQHRVLSAALIVLQKPKDVTSVDGRHSNQPEARQDQEMVVGGRSCYLTAHPRLDVVLPAKSPAMVS